MLKYSQVLGCGDGSVGNVSCTTMTIRVWTQYSEKTGMVVATISPVLGRTDRSSLAGPDE